MNPKTYSAKRDELNPRWYLLDAEGQVLGRLASTIAIILRGKHKPTYTPHLNCGDYVIVVNAAKVDVTRNRRDQKMYYTHSQYPGGLKEETLRQALARHPERVIERAVKGMLPHNRLGDDLLHRMKVYAGPEHPHQGQQPQPWAQPTAASILAEQARAAGELTDETAVTEGSEETETAETEA